MSRWDKNDQRLRKLRQLFEGYPNPSNPSPPSISSLKKELGGLEGKDGIEAIVNYLIDVLIRCGYLLDKQINAVEKKHETEGGYSENLLKKRLAYKYKTNS